jgi:hypothetical protein
MGMDQTITFGNKPPPTWEAVRSLLAHCGLPVQLRMIDGELAFPDEAPPATWRELRLGLPPGMITLRREEDRLVCVTWGNADAGLRQAWNAVAWACAAAGDGLVNGQDAATFQQNADLPPELRTQRPN